MKSKLNTNLLKRPFGVQTNWHVITGAPSCGKTTLIDLLAEAGYQTVPETARIYMEAEIARGRTIAEVHAKPAALQRILINRQLAVERSLPVNDLLFLDGAVPGSLAWYRFFDLDPYQIFPECAHHRYASVFILDRLPLHLDGLRFKDEALIGFLDEWLTRDYCDLGYNVIRVPVLPPKKRLAFVLERIPQVDGDKPDAHGKRT
jgi:predicted ATPase